MLTMIAALATLQGNPDLETRVETALAKMSLAEKLDLIGGTDDFYVRAIPQAGLPRLKMSDGPVGTRNDGPTTAYPAGFTLAATWNPDLAKRFGTAIGRDARARGIHIWLGPGVNLSRVVQNGRNFEYLGEDPLLAGRLATGIIEGVQSQGVVATVKHFAGNEHENDRNNDDSRIDERTLRELYLKPFEMAVKDGHVGAVMTSYNLVNGVHASENRPLVTDILKGEWGFRGIVMSDWVSTYSAEGPYLNGLDLEMPSARYMNRKNLEASIQSGRLPVEPLNDKVRRILRMTYAMEWDKRSQKLDSISLDDPQNASVAIEAARQGTILLKNKGGLLPLAKTRQRVLVVGPNADPAVTGGGGSSYTTPYRSVGVLEAMRRLAPVGTSVEYARGVPDTSASARRTEFAQPDGTPGLKAQYYRGKDLAGTPLKTSAESHLDHDWKQGAPEGLSGSFSVRWSGRFTPKESGQHLLTATTDDGMRVFVDGKAVVNEWHDQGKTSYRVPLRLTAGKPVDLVVEYYQGGGDAVAQVGISRSFDTMLEQELPRDTVASADAVVACVGFSSSSESEGFDRPWALPAEQEAMLRRLVSLNPHVVVVLNAGAGVDAQGWIGKSAGFLHAGYPGGEGNLALAEILYGLASPSGKLPTSLPASLAGTYYAEAYPSKNRVMTYQEGPFIGYRWLDRNGVKPLFPFGFGLTYSKFALSNAKAEGGDTIRVSVDLKNVGARAASETVQVYAEPPQGPVARSPRELRAFSKVALAPGRSQRVELSFARQDLARWDVGRHGWVVDPGTYRLRIGTSSRDLPLTVPIQIP